MAESNWRNVAAKIAARIESGEMAPGTRMPSGDAVAVQMGVNRNVVHRALEELQRSGLVVRRQGSGTFVADRNRKKLERIALLVDGYSAIHNFPSGDLLRGIQDRIGEEASLVIGDSKHDPVQEERQLRRLMREADGILAYACSPERSEAIASVLGEGYPIVAIDRIPHNVQIDAAVTENEGAVRGVIESLVERGHRRIGFIGIYKPAFSSVLERRAGYQGAMAAAGLDPEELVRWLPEGTNPYPWMLERLVRDTILGLRHQAEPITALFCVEDSIGCAAVVGCERLGIELPTDLEIATFIDWHPMTLHKPWNVRRIVQRKYDLGHAAAGLLLDRIASPERPYRTVRVEVDIIPVDLDYQSSSSPSVTDSYSTKEGPIV